MGLGGGGELQNTAKNEYNFEFMQDLIEADRQMTVTAIVIIARRG